MELRTILYGYRKKQFRFYPDTEEAAIVRKIFADYISGKTLLNIANELTEQGVVYYKDKTTWSKQAVRRILENEHYVGDADYPAIINKETYQKANELRLGKGGDRETDTPEVKFLKYHSVCGQCGNRFTRRRNWSHSREKWYCPCGCKNSIYIDDDSFYQSIVNVLNKVVSEPERLRIESENDDSYCPTVDVLRQQKEIDRMMERKNVSFLPVKKTIFACVTEQFDCCELDKSKEMTDLLIEYFRRLLPIEQIELEMVKKVVVSITVKENGRITVRFLNGAEIDEEDNYADSNNALPEDNNEN